MRRRSKVALGVSGLLGVAGLAIGSGFLVTTSGGHVSSSDVYPLGVLQEAAQMTQAMSASTASGPMFTGRIVDEQLKLSVRDPEFVRELNAYVQHRDRMLAKAP